MIHLLNQLTGRGRVLFIAATVAVMSALAGAITGDALAVTDWTSMTTALTSEFDAAKVVILPVAGGILALFLGYKVIKRFT